MFVFLGSCWRSLSELDTSKLQFSTGNGRRVTGDSKNEIKLCYIFQAVWLGVAWSERKKQPFWVDFIHVAACLFPPSRRKDVSGLA